MHGSLFATTAMKRLESAIGPLKSCTFAFCRLGSEMQKYTTLVYTPDASTVLDQLSSPKYQCNHPKNSHTKTAGGRKASGGWASSDAARCGGVPRSGEPYPSDGLYQSSHRQHSASRGSEPSSGAGVEVDATYRCGQACSGQRSRRRTCGSPELLRGQVLSSSSGAAASRRRRRFDPSGVPRVWQRSYHRHARRPPCGPALRSRGPGSARTIGPCRASGEVISEGEV